MDIEKLEKIIGEVNDELYDKDLTSEKITARLNDYQDENGRIDINSALAFAMQESRDYTTIFTHDLLIRLIDEGYLIDPDKDL